MSDNRLGYVVVTFNQASGQPQLDDWGLYDDAMCAQEAAAAAQHATDQIGRRERHVVAEVIEVDPAGVGGAS